MFLRRYQRTKEGKKHAYFALVESQRTERGPRQRLAAQLGELSEDQQRICAHRDVTPGEFATQPQAPTDGLFE